MKFTGALCLHTAIVFSFIGRFSLGVIRGNERIHLHEIAAEELFLLICQQVFWPRPLLWKHGQSCSVPRFSFDLKEYLPKEKKQ